MSRARNLAEWFLSAVLILIILFIFLVAFAGCTSEADVVDNRMMEMKYTRDTRTNICYAYFVDFNQLGLATVPCEKVQNLLPQHLRGVVHDVETDK